MPFHGAEAAPDAPGTPRNRRILLSPSTEAVVEMEPVQILAAAEENLYPARMQMALSLGWHIVFACFGVAFPLITVFAEWRGHRRGDAALLALARTWAKAMGILYMSDCVSQGSPWVPRNSSAPWPSTTAAHHSTNS